MSKIFLSHSSLDKPFVRRLAVDLINASFPVWLDEWELDIGDSLTSHIYDGIDESTFFILVMSTKSLKSGWVMKELSAGLSKEDRDGRRFILPVKAEECDPPLQVADRIFADFSRGYHGQLEKLTSALRRKGVDDSLVLLEDALVPMPFHEIHLDTTAFQTRLEYMLARYGAVLQVTPRQVVILNDPEYDELRRRMIERLDNIRSDSYFSPAFEQSFRSNYQAVLQYECRLVEGVCLIISNLLGTRGAWFVSESCAWFARLIRSSLLALLYMLQNPDDESSLSYGKKCDLVPLGSNRSSASFYGVPHTTGCDIGSKTAAFYCTMSSDQPFITDAKESGLFQMVPMLPNISSDALHKYVVPQMVLRMLSNVWPSDRWGFESFKIGVY